LSQIRPLSLQLAQAEQRRDECLAALGSRMRQTLADDPRFHDELQAVDAISAVRGQVADQLQQAQDCVAAEMQVLDQTLLREQEKLTNVELLAQQAEQQCEDAEMGLKRELARVQRLRIEQRNLEQADAPQANEPSSLEDLKAQIEALSPRIETAQRAERASRQALQKARSAVDQLKAQVTELERRKGVVGRSLSVQVEEASSFANTAAKQQHKALANLGRTLLAANGRIPIDDATLDELLHHDDTVKELWLRHELHLKALSNYDRAAARRGLLVLIALVALMLLTFIGRRLT
jgi:chromosome segregation ATPase